MMKIRQWVSAIFPCQRALRLELEHTSEELDRQAEASRLADWPYKATKRDKAKLLAAADRKGLKAQ